MARLSMAERVANQAKGAGQKLPKPVKAQSSGKEAPPGAPEESPATLPLEGRCVAPFAGLVETPLHWLVPAWIPRDDLTLIAGKRCCGKSSYISRVAAWASAGRCSWAAPPPPGNVLYYSPEERSTGALLGRARAAGCELTRLDNGLMQQPGRPPDRPILGVATKPLTDRLDVVRPTLLVFDSIKSFLPADMSLSDGPGVRAVLEWLQVIARSRRITILITLHLRKQKAEDELDTVSHSAEWTNVPRQVLMMGRDPRQRGRYILSVAKQAEGVATPPVYYRIKERVGWGYWDPMGEAPVSSADLAGEDEGPMERSRRDLARDYLRKVLTDEDMPSSQLREDCEQTGISWRTLSRAAADLGVTRRFATEDGHRRFYWCAPAEWPA